MSGDLSVIEVQIAGVDVLLPKQAADKLAELRKDQERLGVAIDALEHIKHWGFHPAGNHAAAAMASINAMAVEPQSVSSAGDARISELKAEVEQFRQTLKAAGDCVDLLEAAGFGAPGKPNTLLAMVNEAIAENAELRNAHAVRLAELQSDITQADKNNDELRNANAELRKRITAIRNLLADGLFVYMPCVSGPGKDVDEAATIELLEQALGDVEKGGAA